MGLENSNVCTWLRWRSYLYLLQRNCEPFVIIALDLFHLSANQYLGWISTHSADAGMSSPCSQCEKANLSPWSNDHQSPLVEASEAGRDCKLWLTMLDEDTQNIQGLPVFVQVRSTKTSTSLSALVKSTSPLSLKQNAKVVFDKRRVKKVLNTMLQLKSKWNCLSFLEIVGGISNRYFWNQ